MFYSIAFFLDVFLISVEIKKSMKALDDCIKNVQCPPHKYFHYEYFFLFKTRDFASEIL